MLLHVPGGLTLSPDQSSLVTCLQAALAIGDSVETDTRLALVALTDRPAVG
jgi:hypothetical protein